MYLLYGSVLNRESEKILRDAVFLEIGMVFARIECGSGKVLTQ